MKKEASGKKGKLWLWIVIAVVLIAAIVAGIIFLPGLLGNKDDDNSGIPELYWNVDREANTDRDTGLSIREPAEDGNYYVRFAHNGEQVEIPVADKKLVNYIDSLDLMGLSLDQNGYVVDIFPVKDVASVIGESLYVQSVSGDTVIANSSIMMNGRKITITLNENLAVYNVSGKGEFVGEKLDASELNPMDTISIYGTLIAEDSEEETVPTHIFVLNKPAESEIYFRADQYYDSTNKVTTREPDENGAYTIKWYCNGEIVELKCKDKDMVSTIDSANYHWCHWGLEFDEEGYIIDIIDSFLASRTLMQCERYDITEVGDDGSYTATSLIKNNGAFVQGVVGADCPIYDISSTAKSEGQDNRRVDSLQLGDRVCIWTDTMGNPVQIYITRRQADSVGYWNVTRSYSSATLQTTRTPNEKGYYEIEMLKAGDTKNTVYYTNDIELATAVDKPTDRCVGLKVGEGNIIEAVYDIEAVFGYTYFCRGYYIMDSTGSVATFLSPSGSGVTKNGVVASGAKVWNVSTIGQYGAETTLQYGDCVYAGKTPIGEVSYAYVTSRALENGESKFYWRIDTRMYDTTNQVTTREPDADGYYSYLFAHEGKQVTLRTNNKDFATALDYQSSAPAFALEVKGDIITAVHAGTYAYGGSRYNGWTVLAVNGNELSVVSSTGTEGTWIYDEDCKIFNVSNSYTSHKGERIYSIKVGDVLANYRDINANPKVLIVKTRETNKIAWPYDPQYDSTNACTTRTADENGWYYIQLAVDGKLQTFKTKNKVVASAVDSYTTPFGIEVSGNNEILYVSTTTYVENVKGAGVTSYTVESASSSSIKAIYTLGSADKTGQSETLPLASNVKIYDVTAEAKANGTFGKSVKLKKGDIIRTYKDNDDNHLYVYVIARNTRDYYSYCSHCEKMVYWTPYVPTSNVVAYDSHYYLASDLDMTSQLRVYSTARDFETVLDLNGHTANRNGGRAALVRYGDTLTIIDSVGGGKLTTKNNTSGGGVIMIAGSSADGIGVVNLYAGTLTVQKGDNETLYSNQGGIVTNNGGIMNMYGGEVINGIVYGKNSEGGVGGNIRVSSGTFNMYGGKISGGKAYGGTYEKQVKDADGNPVYDEAGNPVMETLAAAGTGGNIYVTGKSSVVNIYDGIIENGTAGRGGNVHVASGVFTMYKGTISGGVVGQAYGRTSDGRGGNIFNTGEVHINGGTVSDGLIIDGYSAGGNIMSTGTSATVYISGDAKVTGGIDENGENSNIYLMYSNLVVSGGTVTVGSEGGDNIYAFGYTAGPSTVTISGGTIDRVRLDGGSVGEDGVDTRCVLTLSGGTVDYIDASSAGNISVSGKPVVKYLKPGAERMTVEGMADGASVTLDVVGVFSAKNTPNAKTIVDKGYFKAYDSVMKVGVTADNELKVYHPNAIAGYCEHCEGEADWMPWTGNSAANGHYFMTADVQLTDEMILAAGAEMVLDLRGYTVTAAENKRCFNAKGDLVVMDTSEGETGVITGGHAVRGGNIYVDTKGTFCLMSGSITNGIADNDLGTSTTNGRGGNIFAFGQVYLFGGTVADGTATNGSGFGGNICVTNQAGGLYMMGDAVVTGGSAKSGGNVYLMYSVLGMDGNAVISNGSATTGKNVYTNGTAAGSSMVTILDGSISGGDLYLGGGTSVTEEKVVDYRTVLIIMGGELDCTVNAAKIGTYAVEDAEGNITVVPAAVHLSGNPVIQELKLGDGVLINAFDLTEGASIAVNASGVISYPMDAANAENALKYISAYNSNIEKVAVNENNELIITSKFDLTTETFYCEHCGQNVAFTSWHGTSISESGHYYLVEDIQLTDTVSVGKNADAIINLNGYTVTAAEGKQAIEVSGNLSVVDSSEAKTGAITGGSAYRGGNIYVNASASFTLYSGTISNGVADNALGSGTTGSRGGNIFANGGNVTLKGGVVSGGNVATETGSKWGGNIFMSGGTLTIEEGAVVTGGAAKAGGNIYLLYANMVMTGGEVKAGTATDGTDGIYMNGTPTAGYSSLNISGGIVDGTVYSGNESNTITVSGTAQITDLSMKGNLIVGEMADGASVKVNATSGTFTDVLTNANAVVGYFDAVDSAYKVVVSADNKLEVVSDGGTTPDPDAPAKEAACEHCGQVVTWTAWDGTAADGHFYLAADVTRTKNVEVSSSKDFVLDLNGQTITADGCRAFYVSGGATLSIQDSVGGGKIVGGNSGTGRGGNIYATGSNVKLYGGSIYGGTSPSDGNQEGNDIAVYNGALVINGDVTIGQAYETGHAIYVFYATELELTKGTVTGGILIRGQNGSEGRADLVLGSDLTVDLLALRDSKLAAVAERTDSALIAIKVTNGENKFLTGTVSFALDNADAVAAYFTSADAAMKIVVEEGVLKLVENNGTDPDPDPTPDPNPDPEPTPTTIYCPHCETEVEWTAWDGTAATGHFYMTENVELTNAVQVNSGKDFVLDLRGLTITADGCRMAYVSGGATLSIVDTVGGGVITGGNANGGRGGNIYATSANVKLYGGTIIGGTATADGDKEGHNVAVYNGGFVMNGDVTIGDADKDGHSLYLFNLTSVELTKGTVVGKAMFRGSFTVALPADVNIDLLVLRDVKISAIAERSNQIAVKVSNAAGAFLKGVFTETMEDAETAATYFVSAEPLYAITVNADNKLELVDGCACGCGTPADQVVWLDANEYMTALKDAGAATITESVHLKLSADLNITELYGAKKQIAIGGEDYDVNVTIDLNGFTWTSDYRMYNYEGCVLTFMDSSEAQTGTMIATGRNTSAHGGVLANYGTLNIRGGTFTQPAGGSLVHKGGVVYQSKGVFNLYDGIIIGGHVLDKDPTLGMGGNVHVYSGVFNMYGGTITGGTAGQGGNVYLRDNESVVFNMYGGNINHGVATEEAEVYVGENATFNYNGGHVGVVVLCDCGCGALAEEVVWFDANEYMTALKDSGAATITENVHLKLTADLNITELYGAKKQIAIGGADVAADPETGAEAYTAPHVNVTIDLNGYTWSSNHRLYVYADNVLTIMDSSEAGTGVMTSTGNNGLAGGVLINYGTINLVSGTLTMSENEASITGGGVVYQSSGTFNMYGGTITGGKVYATNAKPAYGGNVYIRSGDFNMYGGTISNGTATAYDDGIISYGAYGSNVYLGASATFNQVGGTIVDADTTVETAN